MENLHHNRSRTTAEGSLSCAAHDAVERSDQNTTNNYTSHHVPLSRCQHVTSQVHLFVGVGEALFEEFEFGDEVVVFVEQALSDPRR